MEKIITINKAEARLLYEKIVGKRFQISYGCLPDKMRVVHFVNYFNDNIEYIDYIIECTCDHVKQTFNFSVNHKRYWCYENILTDSEEWG